MLRRVQDSIGNLEKALKNFEDALAIPKDRPLVCEGTVHRFEIAIELFWKTLQRALIHEGLNPNSPRSSVREAFRIGWISDEFAWLDMLDSRNKSSHEYLDDDYVEDHYDSVREFAPVLRQAFDDLRARYPIS